MMLLIVCMSLIITYKFYSQRLRDKKIHMESEMRTERGYQN